jgi:hypothetical protein
VITIEVGDNLAFTLIIVSLALIVASLVRHRRR